MAMVEDNDSWDAINPFSNSGEHARDQPASAESSGGGANRSDGGPSGQFRFSDEEMVAIRNDLDQLLDKIRVLPRDMNFLGAVQPPGYEEASKVVSRAMNASSRKYAESMQSLQSWAEHLYDRAEQALPAYLRNEEESAQSMGGSGKEL